MLTDRIEPGWIDAFEEVFALCKMRKEETIAILSESQSRPLNLHLTELALARMGLGYFHLQVPTPRAPNGPI
ncbi:MAG: peptidase M29, partial [Pseudomonadota bacterium]